MNSILITGANRGIGLEMVKQYAADSWQVLACCRAPEKADSLQQLKEKYVNINIFELDVTQITHIQYVANHLKNRPIDILINNAGIWGPQNQSFGFTDPAAWIETFKVNVLGPQLLTEALINNIEQSQLKIIANMASNMGSITSNNLGNFYVYRSTKAALSAITKNMAIDLKDKAITVIALHPGWVKTDMGGSNAKLGVEESVNGIKTVLSQLSLKNSGAFLSYDNQLLAW